MLRTVRYSTASKKIDHRSHGFDFPYHCPERLAEISVVGRAVRALVYKASTAHPTHYHIFCGFREQCTTSAINFIHRLLIDCLLDLKLFI